MSDFKVSTPQSPDEYREYFDLRWRVLREPWGQPRGSEKDQWEETAVHFLCRDQQGSLAGVGRLHFVDPVQVQLRYMATEPIFRGKGVGSKIVTEMERHASLYRVQRITLNARSAAVGFYERLGYHVVGPGQTLFNEIHHSRMEKRLDFIEQPSI